MRTILHILVFFLFFHLIPAQAIQKYSPKIANPILEPWRWQQFAELNGKGCRCMTEDKNGSLWFGINGGVLRYDGSNWQFFPFSDDLAQSSVVAILAASDGVIYAGTPKGIGRLRYGTWQYISLNLGYADSLDFPHNQLPIQETTDRSIWIGTNYGALRIRNGEMSLYREEQVYPNLQNKSSEYIEKEIRSLQPFDVFSIMEEDDRTIWIGLRDGHLYRCTFYSTNMVSSPRWKDIGKRQDYVKAKHPQITKTRSGAIIVISGENSKGVNIYQNSTWKQIELNIIFNGVGDIHADILESEDGTLWISGVGRLFQLRNKKWQIYEVPKLSLPSSRLKLFEASDKSIWIIGLCNEAWRIDFSTRRWATYNDLNYQCESNAGDKWFITHDFKIVKCDSSMKDWILYDESDGLMDAPNRIIITKDDMVWASGSHKQIAATAFLAGDRWQRHFHPSLSWSFEWRAAFEANDGSLWFGVSPDYEVDKGQRGGLVHYPRPNHISDDIEQLEYHYFDQNFYINGVYGIGQGVDDLLWVGQLGLFSLSNVKKKWNEITEPAGINKQFIDCVNSCPEGNIWLGCRTNGIFRLNSRTHEWTNFTTENGLSGNTIINIWAQCNSNVWVITDQNICHFDGQSWTQNVFPEFFKFTTAGGALRMDRDSTLWINQLHRSWHRFPMNKIFPSDDPFQRFRTLHYQPDKNHPETVITFSEERVSQPGNFLVSWQGRDHWKLTPDNLLEYSYRLDLEPWSPYTLETSKIFLDVADGEHTLEVRARDRDFNVDPLPAKIEFRVIPPTWKQPWFIGLISFFLLTIMFFIYRILHRDRVIRELSDAKTRLFTNISHELRTPLTLIIGPMRNIIKSMQTDDSRYDQISMIYRNSKRLMRLVNQVLELQKIEAKQLKFEPGRGDIIAFINEDIKSFQPLAEEKQIDLKMRSDIAELDMWFDSDKLEKILFNILSNAFKFTPKNGEITVSVFHIEKNEKDINKQHHKKQKFKNWIAINITDNGVGIPEDKIEKVFDRFFQVSDNHTGGTGIGLSLTKDLVELHLGELSLNSQVGIGSVFKIRLPIITDIESVTTSHMPPNLQVIPDNFEPLEQHQPQHQIQSGEKSHAKILIVEDNSDMRSFIRKGLESEYNIDEASDGKEGIQLAAQLMPDLIISDIMMPHVDGLKFCKNIKTDERTSHIPVILLTARFSQVNKIKGLETGADDYLTKPFDDKELKIRVHNLIESRRKLRERFTKELRIEPEEITITSVDEKLLKKAIAIVEENMDNHEFDVEFLSRKIGMSRVSLYHKLKALTNSSVQEFIFTIRLKRAAQLLKASGMNVTEVAFEVGFKDSSHFSKLFKKQFGKSPSTFIKESLQ